MRNTKYQINSKFKNLSIKHLLSFRIWDLWFIWNLVFLIWDLLLLPLFNGERQLRHITHPKIPNPSIT